jgi:succinate dehydrogenase flavin-adding protein (antitoxin of CptAB toxin-antitoxin module)
MWTQTTTNDNLDIQEDTIVQSVIEKFYGRSQVGIKKYNTTLDRNDLSLYEWISHAQEEIMDFILYLEKVKKIVDSGKEKNP